MSSNDAEKAAKPAPLEDPKKSEAESSEPKIPTKDRKHAPSGKMPGITEDLEAKTIEFKIEKYFGLKTVIGQAVDKIRLDWTVRLFGYQSEIAKVLRAAEIIKTRTPFLHQHSEIIEMSREIEVKSDAEGDPPSKLVQQQLYGLAIKLSRNELKLVTDVGYQKPKPRQFIQLRGGLKQGESESAKELAKEQAKEAAGGPPKYEGKNSSRQKLVWRPKQEQSSKESQEKVSEEMPLEKPAERKDRKKNNRRGKKKIARIFSEPRQRKKSFDDRRSKQGPPMEKAAYSKDLGNKKQDRLDNRNDMKPDLDWDVDPRSMRLADRLQDDQRRGYSGDRRFAKDRNRQGGVRVVKDLGDNRNSRRGRPSFDGLSQDRPGFFAGKKPFGVNKDRRANILHQKAFDEIEHERMDRQRRNQRGRGGYEARN